MLTVVPSGIAAWSSGPWPAAVATGFAILLALLLCWRIRFEIRPHEVIRSAGPLAFLTRTSVPLSSFASVVCDYDRSLDRDTIYIPADSELDDGPEAIVVRYNYRVALVGESVSWRLGAFRSQLEAERLAHTLASRFGLALVNVQAHPSIEQVRETEHVGSWVLVREAD